ncbi:trypsin-like serine peptidase [Pelagibius marinus]|uniref:trypsin-like serine peptidase n=1 Tax=Pelagibius marinus TaxID=2762760 RepID=UPI001872D445|nr:trypsin-like serine protease [Pelagibius marinus]
MPSNKRQDRPHGRDRTAASAGTIGKAVCATALLLLLQACAAPPPPPEPEPGGVAPSAPPPAGAPIALDGRLQVDAQEYPWSAIGRLNVAGRTFCNGVLIGPQQVLTQARCLYDARNGRWYRPLELHFIAAYQSDNFLANSPVAAFTAAPGFSPTGGTNLSNLTNNWAVVSLEKPIGRTTGWLGVEWDNSRLQAAADSGKAAYLRAGYRADWPHALSVHFGCGEQAGGLGNVCSATPTELALPSFVLTSGELRVLGDYYLRSAAQGSAFSQAAAAPINDNRLGRATAPATGGPVRQQPQVSVSRFLQGLGYDVDGRGLEGAIADYLADRGQSASGGASIELLTSLVNAAQRQP